MELVIWSEERIPKAFLPNLKSKPKQLLVSGSVCFSQLFPPKKEKNDDDLRTAGRRCPLRAAQFYVKT